MRRRHSYWVPPTNIFHLLVYSFVLNKGSISLQVANHYRQVLVYTQFRWSEIFPCSLRNTCILNRSTSLAILIPVCSSPALDLLDPWPPPWSCCRPESPRAERPSQPEPPCWVFHLVGVLSGFRLTFLCQIWIVHSTATPAHWGVTGIYSLAAVPEPGLLLLQSTNLLGSLLRAFLFGLLAGVPSHVHVQFVETLPPCFSFLLSSVICQLSSR